MFAFSMYEFYECCFCSVVTKKMRFFASNRKLPPNPIIPNLRNKHNYTILLPNPPLFLHFFLPESQIHRRPAISSDLVCIRQLSAGSSETHAWVSLDLVVGQARPRRGSRETHAAWVSPDPDPSKKTRFKLA
jgi:hypothetical protein